MLGRLSELVLNVMSLRGIEEFRRTDIASLRQGGSGKMWL